MTFVLKEVGINKALELGYVSQVLPATQGMKILSGNPLEISILFTLLLTVIVATVLIYFKLQRLKVSS